DSTTSLHVQDTAVTLPTDPPPGGVVLDSQNQPHAVIPKRTFLNHPAVARRLARGSSLVAAFQSSGPIQAPDAIAGTSEQSEVARQSTLVADTGNNRVVEFNPAGKAIGEWTEVQDPFKLLPSGETRSLSQPTDVQRWV